MTSNTLLRYVQPTQYRNALKLAKLRHPQQLSMYYK